MEHYYKVDAANFVAAYDHPQTFTWGDILLSDKHYIQILIVPHVTPRDVIK